MSQYHYNYSQGGSGRDNRNGGSFIEMLLDAVLSVIVAIPSLIAMAVSKLSAALGESGSGQTAAKPGPSQTAAQTGGVGGPSSNLHQVRRPSSSAPLGEKKKPAKAARSVKATAGRGAIVLGSILLGLFGSSYAICLAEEATAGALTATGIFAGIGLLTLWRGLRKRKKARLYLRYLSLIGRRESVSLTTLAQAAGRSHKKVCKELQAMLDQGLLPQGYLDLAADQLVLSAQGIADRPAAQAPARPKAETEDENDILRQIREVNDSIPDPVMSAKIDRIGEITGKILDYQRKNPGKASQLRSFLNYYLPTTLKILRAYAQLDKQGVEGENISAAKARIEGMMDKVVEGFEKQLDRLFQDEALDITSDVAVLEQMLDKDGLGDRGFTMEL